MSLEAAVATPFRDRGRSRLATGEFVVALSLDRDWFTPDQAKRLVDVAAGRGLVTRDDGDLVAEFDPADVPVPEGFVPDESVLHEQSTFERVLDALVDAGAEKRAAVAAINERQRDLDVSVEAAAVLHARRQGVDVDDDAGRVLADLRRHGTAGDEPGTGTDVESEGDAESEAGADAEANEGTRTDGRTGAETGTDRRRGGR